MNETIKTIIFDYGGTIDTDGIHWSEKFWDAYQKFHLSVQKKDFRDAFVYSERKIGKIIKPDFNLKQTYATQITYQFEYLEKAELLSGFSYVLIESLINYCLESVLNNIDKNKILFSALNQEYKLGIISNYYGNLENVLSETGIKDYFHSILDSGIIGVRKPEKRIFELSMEMLNALPETTLMIGDSYENDIIPAQELGCKTIWLEGRSWNEPIGTNKIDAKIKSLKELHSTIEKL